MLDNRYLTKLAVKQQTTEVNIRREYVQHLLLSYLYQQPAGENLFFKGGTALRLVHQSPRFSEDLDFDASVHRRTVWEKAVETVLVSLAAEGAGVDIRVSSRLALCGKARYNLVKTWMEDARPAAPIREPNPLAQNMLHLYGLELGFGIKLFF